MFDSKIVAACIADRAAYSKVKPHINAKEFTPTGRFWWGQVERWYDADDRCKRIDPEVLRERGGREAGRKTEESLEWFDSMPDTPSPENVAWEVLELKREIAWSSLAEAMEGARDDREKLIRLTNEHAELMAATDLITSTVAYGKDAEELLSYMTGNKIPLFPDALNVKTDGGAIPGTHIVVFGRKESGKTLFAVNMVAGWLRLGKRVLYVGNEESAESIQMRIATNLSGMNKHEFTQYEETGWQRCYAKGWDNLRVVHLWPGSTPEVEEQIELFNPDCLVVDQIRNMHSVRLSGTRAQALDAVACEIRQLLSKYGLVGLSVGQANAGEHGKTRIWLETNDFDESRTGIPGQSDLMVGLGFDGAMDAHHKRAVSLPANKLSGDHEGFTVTIDNQRSRIL